MIMAEHLMLLELHLIMLVLGNMNAAKAKELNIRDCVSISNHIGPFLIVNGEAQDIVGIAGELIQELL